MSGWLRRKFPTGGEHRFRVAGAADHHRLGGQGGNGCGSTCPPDRLVPPPESVRAHSAGLAVEWRGSAGMRCRPPGPGSDGPDGIGRRSCGPCRTTVCLFSRRPNQIAKGSNTARISAPPTSSIAERKQSAMALTIIAMTPQPTGQRFCAKTGRWPGRRLGGWVVVGTLDDLPRVSDPVRCETRIATFFAASSVLPSGMVALRAAHRRVLPVSWHSPYGRFAFRSVRWPGDGLAVDRVAIHRVCRRRIDSVLFSRFLIGCPVPASDQNRDSSGLSAKLSID